MIVEPGPAGVLSLAEQRGYPSEIWRGPTRTVTDPAPTAALSDHLPGPRCWRLTLAAGFGGSARDGRPGLSPAQPATVCALQYALNLSDRQASEAVRCRIDFKYALGLELEDLGFHHSVLSDFRDRLAEGDRADRLPGLAPTRTRRAGLLEERAARGSRHLHRL